MDDERVIIQIDAPSGGRLTIDDARRLLADTGIELDEQYGPIAVDPAKSRYVVRGKASPDAVKRAAALPGITLFADSRQQPMQR